MKRYFYLIIATLSMMFAGINYGWSILKSPLAVEFAWTPPQLAINFTLTMSFFCLGNILAGYIARYAGTKVTLFSGIILAGASFIFFAKFATDDIRLLYLTYGIIAGSGIGMIYNSIISILNKWFPDKKGLCSGLLMMGFGSSALILGTLAEKMIVNPAIGWRTTYTVFGAAILIVIGITGLIIKEPKLDQEQSKLPVSGMAVKEMIRTKTFYMFFVVLVGINMMGITVISFAKDYIMDLGANPILAATLVGVLSMFNGIGRIMSGLIYDKKGHTFTMIMASSMTFLAALSILAGAYLNIFIIGVISFCIVGFSYGCSPTMTAVYTRAWFGDKWFASNFSILTTALIPASLVATLAGKLYSTSGNYLGVSLVLLCFATISLFLGVKLSKVK